ncbi:Hypothetical predicted protein, partial [Scomber scombrus]
MPATHAVSLNPTAALRLDRDIGHYDASDRCRLLTLTAAFRLVMDIRHIRQPMLFICPTTALRSNRNIGHRDARNPCRLLTPITACRLDQNIDTRMPMTPAISSLHFNSARMFD